MAAPTMDNSVATVNNSGTTSHTCNTPSGGPGDRLYFTITGEGSLAATQASSTSLRETNISRYIHTFYKDDASESSITITTAISTRSVCMCWRVSGDRDPAGQEADHNVANAGSGLPNPPSVTVTGGSNDILVLAIGVLDNAENISGAPSGYNDLLTGSTSGGSRVTGCGAWDTFTAATSEDPGAFTGGGNDDWIAHTVVIQPPPPPTLLTANGKLLTMTGGSAVYTFATPGDSSPIILSGGDAQIERPGPIGNDLKMIYHGGRRWN